MKRFFLLSLSFLLAVASCSAQKTVQFPDQRPALEQRLFTSEAVEAKITEVAARCTDLADEVAAALQKYAVVDHPEFGKIYAYEVDGFGNAYLMDDANVPSLLALTYLDPSLKADPVAVNTRSFVWSDANPYYWRGKAGEGIGGPHIGTEVIWPMSIMMRAFTSDDDAEIADCLRLLMATDAGTGFIHESFNRNDATDFTRPWFAWQNTLFGELVIKLVNDGKLNVLNNL